jgi:hypothetical protein
MLYHAAGLNLSFVQEWVNGTISLEREYVEAEFGFSVLLLAIAKGSAKTQFLSRNMQLEARLEGLT